MSIRIFAEFIRENIVIKQSPNKSRAEALIGEAKEKKKFLERTLKIIPADEMNANFVIETSYDVILELVRAKMFLVGYNSTGSHEAEVSYMRILGFSEADIIFTDELRYYRNGIKYYGKKFDMEYANKVLLFLDKIYNMLEATMIKLIIFDIGGLLVENYDIPMFEALVKACNKSREQVEKESAELMQKSERAEISEYEFLTQFLRKMNAKEDPQKIVDARRNGVKEVQEMRKLIEKIKKHYNVAFATNNAREEFEYNNKIMHFNKLFDWGIASWQAHARKTEAKIFEEILKHFKINPEEAMFIDDSINNLITPKQLGMKTIQFFSLEQLRDELKKAKIIF